MERLLKKGILRRTAHVLIALVFIFALLAPEMIIPAQAASKSTIRTLKNNASDLSARKRTIQKKLDTLSSSKSSTLEKKKLLDEKIRVIASQISNTENQISTYSSKISKTEAELADAQEKEQAQYQLYRKRVRAMEERGTISYWAVLFKASSFTDLLSRLDFINEIMDSDQDVINQLQDLQKSIKSKKASLESDRSAYQSAKTSLVSKKSDLNTQRTEATALVTKINKNTSEYQKTLNSIAAEENSIQDKIVKMSRELAAKQEAERKKNASKGSQGSSGGYPTTPSSSGYIWPVASHQINSPFGYRPASATNGIGSTYHKGIDIGGVGYGSPVHASKAGNVLIAQSSSSYGNYVAISHGSGNTTLYAHLSSFTVSAGQFVSQGTVIGYTGATGHATGPHLHFGITINGSWVNPLNYLP